MAGGASARCRWANWRMGQANALTAGFMPTKGAGTYQFRARLGKQATATSKKYKGWSVPATISVT